MKKTILLLYFILSFWANIVTTFGQVSGSTYYGKDAMRYKGTKLRVISSQLPHPYFMVDKNQRYNAPGNVYLPNERGNASDPKKIFGLEFIVENVTEHPTETDTYYLEMKEVKSGQPVYYYYNPFAKVFGAMQVVDDSTPTSPTSIAKGEAASVSSSAIEKKPETIDYCSQIEREKDKFTEDVHYSSATRLYSRMVAYKDIFKNKPVAYTLSLRTYGPTVLLNKKGVIILS